MRLLPTRRGLSMPARAAEPALPGRRRSGHLGAERCGSKPACAGLDSAKGLRILRWHVQGATRSERPWEPN